MEQNTPDLEQRAEEKPSFTEKYNPIYRLMRALFPPTPVIEGPLRDSLYRPRRDALTRDRHTYHVFVSAEERARRKAEFADYIF